MFYSDINPVLVEIGPFTVRWYGLIFALGLLVSFLLIRHLARKRQLPLSGKDFDEFFLLATLSIIIGARLGNIFSSLGYYLANPVQMIAVWNGGLSFHGGFVGLVVLTVLFAKRKKISFYDLADIVVIPAALALAFGRIANFINGEFYGTVTGLPWGVKFGSVEGFRHPVQIYESIKNLAIFVVLWQLRGKKLPKGFLFWLFVLLYGAMRFPLEYLKVVPEFAIGMTWGQFWSIPMVLAGGYMLWKVWRSKPQGSKAVNAAA